MKAEEFYKDLENKKSFTKLTNTGISDNLENVFEFAESYAKSLLEDAADKVADLYSKNKYEKDWYSAIDEAEKEVRSLIFPVNHPNNNPPN